MQYNSDRPYGNWATLLLPINADDSIDFRLLAEEIDILIEARVNGIYSNGTACEFYNQTEHEFDRISILVAEKCRAAGMPFQIGCSHMSPLLSLERIRRAKPLGPNAIQVILPDWWLPSDEEMIRFLSRIVEEADPVGIVLYNPPHAKKQLTPDDFALIQQHRIELVGCKVAGGNDQWYAAMREKMSHLSVFIPGHRLATGLMNGAHGAYSNVCCINPVAAQRWYEGMKENPEYGLELEGRILRFMNECIRPYLERGKFSNQAVDKFMAAVGGWSSLTTRLRWPYSSIPMEEVPAVRSAARNIIPEFFTST